MENQYDPLATIVAETDHYKVISSLSGARPIKAWTKGVPIEDGAMKQLINVASMPFIGPHVAAMPDVHFGIGATVGSVIPTEKAIIPAAVGVDIGCGMMAVRLSLTASDLPDSLKEVREKIEYAVPHGRTNKGQVGDRSAWGNVNSRRDIMDSWYLAPQGNSLATRFDAIVQKYPRAGEG
jgi:tRNA-splicing ligase RtcB